MIIVTGGAGFIGSCIVRTLNDAGIDDIVIVDNIASSEKWKNIRNKKYLNYVHKSEFLAKLPEYQNVTAIIHMGACSSTTEKDFDYLKRNNFDFTCSLWNYCAEKQISFIYASSAATYGDGSKGFDDKSDIDELLPLNGYGYSKQMFDLYVKHQAKVFPSQHAGLKFFNVYGPNEYYKGTMASMVFHGFNQLKADGEIRLFKSYKPEYPDGGQLRDFVYVKDICSIVMWFLENKKVSGLFNAGTGHAQSFEELAEAVLRNSAVRGGGIRFIDMPENLKGKYQYYTQAKISSLREAGYTKKFMTLEEGVKDYVCEYLSQDYLNY